MLLVAARSTGWPHPLGVASARQSHSEPVPAIVTMSWLLTCVVVPVCVRSMHRQFSCSSCEALRGSIFAVGSEWMLPVAIAKRSTMAVRRQWLDTSEKSTCCGTQVAPRHEAMLTHAAMLYGCSPCDGACMSCGWVAGACVVGRRSMG